MKKKISLIAALLMIGALLLTGCGQKLASGFDKTTVENAAKSVVTLINNKDNTSIINMGTPTFQTSFTDDVFKQFYAFVDAGGKFVEIKSMAVTGTTENKVDYATAIVNVKYENKSFIYTIAFTKDMKLAGLYCK